ncbi:hypothetical protein LUZ100_gp54 [Pseudomonas phage LUZ100]|uniref:Uncharacterized protein n=1 Tax=Pseudomonas phage LUZ100 TaxID=2973522 RepID=A0A9Y1DII2_9CAUD|nr:hypothetical protein LUZ100_gp54 [Pseudomonas phage LUZ100]
MDVTEGSRRLLSVSLQDRCKIDDVQLPHSSGGKGKKNREKLIDYL